MSVAIHVIYVVRVYADVDRRTRSASNSIGATLAVLCIHSSSYVDREALL